MVRWECRVCGKRYKSNPEKCGNCENTVFTPYDKPSLRSRLFGGGSESGGKQTVVHSGATTKKKYGSGSGTARASQSDSGSRAKEDDGAGSAEQEEPYSETDPSYNEPEPRLPVWVWVILLGMGLWGIGYVIAQLLIL